MAGAGDHQSIVDAAKKAAAAGDYGAAERILRVAAASQEAELGPLHPDLANTLNNLGVVCDLADRPDEAEVCYRRACDIASTVLDPSHPFVQTSRKNLEEFCRARGRPLDLLKPTLAPAVSPAQDPTTDLPQAQPPPLPRAESQPVAGRQPRRTLWASLTAIGVVLVMLLASRPWVGRDAGKPSTALRGSAASQETQAPAPPQPPSTQQTSPSAATSAPASTTAPRAATTARPESPGKPSPAKPDRGAEPAVTVPGLVADARLCRDLSTTPSPTKGDWRCDPPGRQVASGTIYFLTRLKSRTATTVQHRWYRGDRLSKVVNLRVQANPTAGYRTYSRQTVDHRNAGDWRVELTTKDGTLLHQEHFVVR